MATVSARKDGSLFRNQLHLSAIENDAGDVAYYFASEIDVTAFRKVQTLEASKHRLLIEVDHRAKDVLVVVDSIVRLSRSDDAASYSASVQQRVQALSMAHGPWPSGRAGMASYSATRCGGKAGRPIQGARRRPNRS